MPTKPPHAQFCRTGKRGGLSVGRHYPNGIGVIARRVQIPFDNEVPAFFARDVNEYRVAVVVNRVDGFARLDNVMRDGPCIGRGVNRSPFGIVGDPRDLFVFLLFHVVSLR